MCTNLGDSPSSSFGIQFLSSENSVTEIEHENQIYQIHISRQDSYYLRFWYAHIASFKVKCYLWTTEDGLPNELPQNGIVSFELLQLLVSFKEL